VAAVSFELQCSEVYFELSKFTLSYEFKFAITSEYTVHPAEHSVTFLT